MWGPTQTQAYAVAQFQFQQRYYNQSSFACHITLRLSGMVTFAHGNPAGIPIRTCNTTDPEMSTAIRDSDTINWNKCCNIQYEPVNHGCFTNKPVCLNMTLIFNQNPNTPACWSKTGPTWQWSTGSTQKFLQLQTATPISTAGNEIDATAMLYSFAAYVQTIKTQLQTTFAPSQVDHAQLLSGYDFHGPVLGIAQLSGMCSTQSTSIIQTTSPTAGYLAAVAAHEMGHSLGMQHDGTQDGIGSNCPVGSNVGTNAFIMAPSTSSNYATTFSTCSSTYINNFFTNSYGDSSHPRCLENNQVGDVNAQVVSVCGDGIVSGSEQCDPSFNPAGDPCCNAQTCQYYSTPSCPTVGPPTTPPPGTTSSPSGGTTIPGTTLPPGITQGPGSPTTAPTSTTRPPTLTPTVSSAGAGGATNGTSSTAFLDQEMGGIKLLYLIIIGGVLVIAILAVLGYCCGCYNLQHGGKQYAVNTPHKQSHHQQVQLSGANQHHHHHHHASSPSHHKLSVRTSIKGPDSSQGSGAWLQQGGVHVQQQSLRSPSAASDPRGSFNVYVSPSPSPYGASPPPYHEVPPTPEGFQLNGGQPQPSPMMHGRSGAY